MTGEKLLFRKFIFCGDGAFLVPRRVFEQEVSVATAPPGMLWIPGGEFSMGAATNGHGTDEMPMAWNDAGPVHRLECSKKWLPELDTEKRLNGDWVWVSGGFKF